MKRYYFELTDRNYNDLGAFIPDGSSKQAAINKARQWLKDNGVNKAVLTINSLKTNNLLDIIDINI